MTFLKIMFCLGLSIVSAAGVTGYIDWLNSRPIKEEKDRPFYITRDLSDYLRG